jgi:hypothetical protein
MAPGPTDDAMKRRLFVSLGLYSLVVVPVLNAEAPREPGESGGQARPILRRFVTSHGCPDYRLTWTDDPRSTVRPVADSLCMLADLVRIRRADRRGLYDGR